MYGSTSCDAEHIHMLATSFSVNSVVQSLGVIGGLGLKG